MPAQYHSQQLDAIVRSLVYWALCLGASALLLWSSTPAVAQEYPIVEDDLTVSDASVEPGSSVTVSGEGFAPGAEVVITFESEPVELARVNADAAGRFTTSVTIPAEAAPGSHVLRASGEAAGGGTLVLASEIVVAGELPATGATVPLWLYAAGGIALLVGVALAFRAVRR